MSSSPKGDLVFSVALPLVEVMAATELQIESHEIFNASFYHQPDTENTHNKALKKAFTIHFKENFNANFCLPVTRFTKK